MNKHVSLSLVYDRFFVKKFDNEEFSNTLIESNGSLHKFLSILWITYSNTTKWKTRQNTFISAELNRVAFVYFKTEMEKVLYIEARRRQGCELKHANNEIHYTKENRVFNPRL